ncbi:MAG: hypothetical protein KF850_03470 [Labilithrix sp.]|nr:hypothetical protein [Labilithrix sp.]
MSIGSKKGSSLLGPLADAYEPTAADADRVFARLQASLGQPSAAPSVDEPAPAKPSVSPRAPRSARPSGAAGAGKKAIFVGLSCAALVLVGAFAMTRSPEAADGLAAPPASTSAFVPAARGPSLEPSSEGEGAPAVPSVSVDSLPSAPVRTSGPAKPTLAPAATASDTLEREARLLADARQARQAGDETRALAFLDEHARTFPNGWLAGDRAAERVVVLCGLGRREEALREATVFLDGRPKGPLTRRVETSCAGSNAGGR